MSAPILYLAGVAITTATSLIVVAYLRVPLRSILTDLCGTLERANFWLAFCNVTLVLVPLMFALSSQPEVEANRPAQAQHERALPDADLLALLGAARQEAQAASRRRRR